MSPVLSFYGQKILTRIGHVFSRCGRIPNALSWRLSPDRRESIHRIEKLKNKYQGRRCFIIGNGPSLKRTNLSLLKNEVTFGLNRIYLFFNQMGFCTTYYVAVNRLVIEQSAQDIMKIPAPKFISYWSHDLVEFTSDMMFIRDPWSGPVRFSSDITRIVWEGTTVTYAAMQIAYYLGFQQVILVGVDHFFQTQGVPHTTIVSEGSDPDHFDPGYFGKGFRWQLPDIETSELAYRLAKLNFERAGRQILDATIDGKLQVFPKVRYEEMF